MNPIEILDMTRKLADFAYCENLITDSEADAYENAIKQIIEEWQLG